MAIHAIAYRLIYAHVRGFWGFAGHLRSAMAPKLDSAQRLGAYMSLHPSQATLAFSSVASLFGSAGQGNYAAANAALEAWSEAQLASGHATTAVQWGAWAAGMKPDSTNTCVQCRV